jgi:hypothetical protein
MVVRGCRHRPHEGPERDAGRVAAVHDGQVHFEVAGRLALHEEGGRRSADRQREVARRVVRDARRRRGPAGRARRRTRHFAPALSQDESSTWSRYGGAGLGLVIGRHFCRLTGAT